MDHSRTLGIVLAGGLGWTCAADTLLEVPANSTAAVDVTVCIDTPLGESCDTQSSGITVNQSSMLVNPSPDNPPFSSMEITEHLLQASNGGASFEFYCTIFGCLFELDVTVQSLVLDLVGNLDVPVDGSGNWSTPSANYTMDLALAYSGSLIGDGTSEVSTSTTISFDGNVAFADGILLVSDLNLDTIVIDVPEESMPDGLDGLLIEVETDLAALIYSGLYNTCDLDGDGSVGGSDLTILLGEWGSCCIGDLDGNGNVDGADLTILLACWTG